MEWLASKGALVWIPLGHSPDVDLMAEFNDQVIRIQVKTCAFRVVTRNGHERWSVSIATNGGNQSWSGQAKKFDPARVDYLFVLVGSGRRWFIPAEILEGSGSVNLGGPKYSEFEVEPGTAIESLVYGDKKPNKIRFVPPLLGECLSGQKDVTVNHTAIAYAGSNPASPIQSLSNPLHISSNEVMGDTTRSEKRLARSGHSLLRRKRQMTVPKRPCAEAGLRVGDRMRVRADGPGRVVFERVERRRPLDSSG
jgi:hypothetical protein